MRLLLVDDDPLVRSGLRYLLDGVSDIEVVAEAADGAAAVVAVAELGADVVLMDLRMPGVGGIDATARIRARQDPPAVLVLTTFDTDAEVVGALRAGALGYLLKDTPPEDLVAAIRRAGAGQSVLSPAVIGRVVAMVGRPSDGDRRSAETRLARLTPGERDVARGVARGLANADIADELRLSPATVKAYVSRSLAKLDLDNRVQLALEVQAAGDPSGVARGTRPWPSCPGRR